jgi:hypothetical protein
LLEKGVWKDEKCRNSFIRKTGREKPFARLGRIILECIITHCLFKAVIEKKT